MLFCLPNVLVTDICLSAVSHLVFRSGQRSKVIKCKKMLNFLNFCTLYVFKRKERPDTKKVLMCICVNKILNKNSAILRYQIVKIRIKALEVFKISER